MTPSIVKQLFIACIHFKTNTCQLETKDFLRNITGKIPKLQNFSGEHQQFKTSLGETQITNTHRGGRKLTPFSSGTDFVGLIFVGELSGVDSAGLLRQDVLRVLLFYNQPCLEFYKHQVCAKMQLEFEEPCACKL